MAMSKTVSATFYGKIKKAELQKFLEEVPDGVDINFDVHKSMDQRDQTSMTLRVNLPLGRSGQPAPR